MKIYALLFLLINTCLTNGQKISWSVPIQAGTKCSSMDMDTSGMLYFVGEYWYYTGDNYFNNTELEQVSNGTEYGYIIKSDTAFSVIWSKSITSTWGITKLHIKFDNDNNFVVSGFYAYDLKIDTLNIISNDVYSHYFIAKFDVEGKLIWYNTLTHKGWHLAVNDMAIDSNNNTYIAGDFTDSLIFYDQSLQDTILNTKRSGGFIAKYDKYGKFIKAKSLITSDQIYISSLIVDKSSNVYISGFCSGEYTFDTTDCRDITLLKINSDFNVEWVKNIGSNAYNTSLENGYSVTLDCKQENLYFTGCFIGSVDFGDKIIQADDKNIFIVKYSIDGKLRWVKNYGNWSGTASFVECGKKVIVDDEDFIYVAGLFNSKATFEDTSIVAYQDPNISNNWNDVFISKFYNNGDLSWVTQVGTVNDDDFNTLFKDKNNNLYVSFNENLSKLKDFKQVNKPDIVNIDNFVKPICPQPEIYPNPIIDKFTVIIPTEIVGDINIQFINISGVLISSFHLNNPGSNFSLDLSGFAPGIYQIIIQGNKYYNCLKAIKL
jgi:hypothetical protein